MARWPIILSMFVAASCGEPTLIIPDTMRVISVAPSHGSINVSVDVNAFVFLSHDPALADDAAAAVEMRCLGTPEPERGCNAPVAAGCPGTLRTSALFESGGSSVRVIPDTALQADTCYVLTVSQGIEAAEANVGGLPATVRSAFQTAP